MKNRLIKYSKIGIFMLFCSSVYGQNSFLKYTNSFSSNLGSMSDISVSKSGNMAIAIPDYPGFNLLRLNTTGDLINAIQIRLDSTDEVHWINTITHVGESPLVSFSLTFNNPITGFCKVGNDISDSWCRRTDSGNFSNAFSTFNGKLFSGINQIPNAMSLAKYFPDSGDVDWAFSYTDDSIDGSYLIRQVSETINENYIVNFLNQGGRITEYGLLKINSNGEQISSISLDTDRFQAFGFSDTDTLGNIYLHGKILNSDTFCCNNADGFIAKFDKDLRLLWTKRLFAENFEFFNLSIKAISNGGVSFSYSSTGNLPIITGEIDIDGNLIWERGYSFLNPKMEIGQDGSIYFLSNYRYFENGTIEESMVFAKTNSEGEIENCPQFAACLTLFDIELPIKNKSWTRLSASVPPMLNFSIEQIPVDIYNHCGTPAPPTPYFLTPDTICQNQCLRPDSLYNHLAHAVEWTITGKNVLFENRDNSFNYCFNTPGKYQIEQEVWLLGCSDFYTREVVVLPDSLGDLLGDDQLICEDTFAVLEPNATRPLRDYLWSDSTRDSSLTVSQSGVYAVEVSDGYCSASDEIEVSFFDEWPSGIDLELPNDTSVCQELLPFTLTPKSDFSNEFFLNGSTTPQSNFEIKTAGNYQISTTIEGCEITKEFNLSLIPCEVDIYIPSSFSPNNDGINDVLEPLGKDFIGQQMQVFDRWGGLLFETKNPPFAWDGYKAEEGVYVVTFSYFNLKNQQEEIVSGDVLVVR